MSAQLLQTIVGAIRNSLYLTLFPLSYMSAALLTSTGSLYTVGHNFYGQCGAGQGYAVSGASTCVVAHFRVHHKGKHS